MLLAALAGGVLALDRWMGRADRMRAAERQQELLTVRDELLRYEAEHGALPGTISQLVPAYLRQDQIEENGQPRYRYDARGRRIAEAQGARVHGLFTRRMKPAELALPVADTSERPPETGSPVAAKTAAGRPAAKTASPKPPAPPHVSSPAPPAHVQPASPPVALPPLAWVVPASPDLPQAPAGALVFEAEHFSEMNYGWEVHSDPRSSGGAYLHCKEGIANGPGQTRYRIGDFYNIRSTKEYTFVRYRFHLPKAGRYYVYGRFWTTDTHCSNNICAAMDRGGPYIGGMENRTPFRWLWSPMKGNPVRLPAGDHYLHLFIHEDGIRIDQFILSPVPLGGGAAYRVNFWPGRDTAWVQRKGPATHLSFDLKSMVIGPATPPQARLVWRKMRPAKGKAVLRVVLKNAAPGGRDWPLVKQQVALGHRPELAFLPLKFQGLDLERLARREYLLQAELRRGGRLLAEAHVPLMRPFAWEAFGPGNYLSNEQPGPLDGSGRPKPGDPRTWRPFQATSFDHFGVLDFGLHCTGNGRHPPPYKTIYARTRIRAPRTDTYLFKLQADDQMLLWLDGREIYRHDENRPVTRAAHAIRVRLEAGEHRLRMRVNQREGRWQASLRIRTQADELSNVVGLELPRPIAQKKGKTNK